MAMYNIREWKMFDSIKKFVNQTIRIDVDLLWGKSQGVFRGIGWIPWINKTRHHDDYMLKTSILKKFQQKEAPRPPHRGPLNPLLEVLHLPQFTGEGCFNNLLKMITCNRHTGLSQSVNDFPPGNAKPCTVFSVGFRIRAASLHFQLLESTA